MFLCFICTVPLNCPGLEGARDYEGVCDSEDGDEVAEQRICTTTTVTRIVARDDVHELSTRRGNFAPKKALQLFVSWPRAKSHI